MEAVLTNISQKKHFGQYFSGNAIASLLAHLADHKNANTIIDPMSGTGDMLAACEPTNSPNKNYYGVEIDNDVCAQSIYRFQFSPNVKILNGDVFKTSVINKIAAFQYDLVITNPPYVRYQTIAGNKLNIPESLSTSEIKENLIASLSQFKHLDTKDRELFKILIANYSGLADLAVPSWFLCSLITKVGGRIAMVVPQTWLNRDYASVIHYLLLKWFQIEYIVEDTNSVWFPNAQVKTTLIVAKRVKRKKSIDTWKNESFQYCSIYAAAKNGSSLIGKIFPAQSCPEKRFTEIIQNSNQHNGFFATSKIRLEDFANDLKQKSANLKWFSVLEPEHKLISVNSNSIKVPSKLKNWLENGPYQFQSLSDIEVNVNQGLRTGANKFFYLDIIKRNKKNLIVSPHKMHYKKQIEIPLKYCREVIRKQTELTDAFTLQDFTASGILLYLQDFVLESDLSPELLGTTNYEKINGELGEHIRLASTLNIGTIDQPRYFLELSAIKPNIRKWNPNNPSQAPRFWYMIPKLAKRHCADLFIPRVNNQSPKTRLNKDVPFVIDANFSTLWLSKNSPDYDNYALLSLLNSTWSLVAMEDYGTTMGGGALKLEATQLKKLPIPLLSKDSIIAMSNLGRKLNERKKDHRQVIIDIDKIILKTLGFKDMYDKKLKELNNLKTRTLKERTFKMKATI